MIKKLTILGIITMQCLHIIAGGCSSKQQVEAQPRVQPALKNVGKRASVNAIQVVKIAAKQRVQLEQNEQRKKTDAQRKEAASGGVVQLQEALPSKEKTQQILTKLARKYTASLGLIRSGRPYNIDNWNKDFTLVHRLPCNDEELRDLNANVTLLLAQVGKAHAERELQRLASERDTTKKGSRSIAAPKSKPKQKKQSGKPRQH